MVTWAIFYMYERRDCRMERRTGENENVKFGAPRASKI